MYRVLHFRLVAGQLILLAILKNYSTETKQVEKIKSERQRTDDHTTMPNVNEFD